MHKFIKKLSTALKPVLEGHGELELSNARIKEEKTDTYKFLDFKCGNIYARITPQDDQGKLLNCEFYRDKMTRMKLSHVSPDLLVEFLVDQVKEHGKPNSTNKAYGKSFEPTTRINADEDEITDEKLDSLIKDLEKVWGDGKYREPDTDQMVNSPEYRKDIVHTFPKDLERIEGTKMPEKKNINPQSFEKDSKVKWHGSRLEEKTVDEEGEPVRLQESLKGKRLIYTAETGAVFVDNELYEQYKNETGTKWGFDKTGRVCLLKLNEHSYNNFMPVNLR